jgi:acetyl esterase/lipase
MHTPPQAGRLRRGLRKLGLAAMLASRSAAAQPAVDHDVPYGANPAQMLDVYHPATGAPGRLVVFVHGGGWVGGNKAGGRLIAQPLTQAGYVVASLGYRLSPETSPAGSVQDAALGIAYLLHNAARFGIDPDKFAILGHSSGAHMVALLGTDATYLRHAGVDPATLAAVITLDGVFDVEANLTDYPNQTRADVFGNDPAGWKRVSPVALVDGMQTHPHFCLVHEDRSPRFIEQERLFETALKQHGEAVEAITAPGLSHGALVGEFADPGTPMAPFTLACLAEVLGPAPRR